MVAQLLVILATAFLTVGLGGVPANADPPVRIAFIAAATVSFLAAAAWSSPRMRTRLPFGRTFQMRCHSLWAEHAPLKAELRKDCVNDDVPEALYTSIVDWDRRVWNTVLAAMRQRGNVLEVRYGGRRENRPHGHRTPGRLCGTG